MQWFRSTIWLGIVAFAGITIGAASAAMQRAGMSPLVIFSLLLGAALGATAVGAAQILAIGSRRLLVVGAVLGSLVLVLSQHTALYRTYVAGWELKRSEKPELPLFRAPPQDFLTYLKQESADGRAWLWLLDAALVTAASVTVVLWWRARTPYCDACGRWLELRWQGSADTADAPPAVKDVCSSTHASTPNAQAILFICPQGCGSAVVKLTWEEGGTTHHQTIKLPA